MFLQRFEGEYDVLVKYGCLNNLAEALYYMDDTPNYTAQKEIRRIHHIREDISFYLRELLYRCQPKQIIAVLMQENLDDDILCVFGYKNVFQRHRNPATEEDKELSEFGLVNLMRFFSEDYAALTRLYCWGKIKQKIFIDAMSYKSGATLCRTAMPLRSKAAGELAGWNSVPSALPKTQV